MRIKLHLIKHIVQTRVIDADILNQTEPNNNTIVYLRNNDFPLVKHGRTSWSSLNSYNDFDTYTVARQSVDLLASHGPKIY